MKNIYWVMLAFLTGGFVSCVELDIPPVNILQDENIYDELGIQAYMAGMYSMLPMDDFKVVQAGVALGKSDGYFGWNCGRWTTNGTGESHTSGSTIAYHYPGYWVEAFKIIRNANRLIDNLPAYVNQLPLAEQWIAESKFIRAYTYFQLVKRYGGMPILDHVQEYDPDFTTLQVPRRSNKECYDFILRDLDDAIAGLPPTGERARANKYVAAGLKSKVALFAATIAKYGEAWVYYSKKDPSLMLCGIPATEADGYFKQAWDAAKLIGDSGQYELFGASASTYDEKVTANIGWYANALTSKESIFIREYDYATYSHSFDILYRPQRLTNGYGNRYGITLDLMEFFDGKNPTTGRDFVDPTTGKLNVLDGENYHVYDNASELYAGVEPRLHSLIMIPNEMYQNIRFDLRSGIIPETMDPADPIKKEFPDDYKTATGYTAVNWPTLFPVVLRSTDNQDNQTDPIKVTTDGTEYSIYKMGVDGTIPNGGKSLATPTGIQGRKWLDFTVPKSGIAVHSSTQPWVDMRYAEILLNRAEAALELSQAGVAHGGVDLQQDAYECINAIRSRAGADLLTSKADLSTDPRYDRADNPGKGGFVHAPNRGLQIIRVERYKELTFEHKIYWDLRRWFTSHTQINDYRTRGLNLFMFAKGAIAEVDPAGYMIPQGKYIYDTRISETWGGVATFSPTQNYYENIPSTELRKSELLEGNRNQ